MKNAINSAQEAQKQINYLKELSKYKTELKKDKQQVRAKVARVRIQKPKKFTSHQDMANYINKFLTPKSSNLTLDYFSFVTAVEEIIKQYKYPRQFYDIISLAPDKPTGQVSVLNKPKAFKSQVEMIMYFDQFMVMDPGLSGVEIEKILAALQHVIKTCFHSNIKDKQMLDAMLLFTLSNPRATFFTISRVLSLIGLKLICVPLTEE